MKIVPVILSLSGVLSSFASLLLIFDNHWGTFTASDDAASGHVGLWATCTKSICVSNDPDWNVTLVRIMTLFGVSWILLMLTIYAVFPMEPKTKYIVIGMGFSGKGLLNLVSSLTYVSWIRLEAPDDGVTYNQSVSEYTMIALAFFDIFLGALGRALGKEG